MRTMIRNNRCTLPLLMGFTFLIILNPKSVNSVNRIYPSRDVNLYRREVAPPIDEVLSNNNASTVLTTYENSTLLLPCSQNIETNYKEIRWRKEGEVIMDSSEPNLDLLSNGSLLLTRLQLEDAGTYLCETMDDDGLWNTIQQHTVEVHYPARVYLTPSGSIQLPIGATLEVICETVGVPLPVISWRMPNQILPRTNTIGNRQTRVIEITSRRMSGSIECLASNGVGEMDRDSVELMVLFPPEIEVKQTVLYTNLGSSQHLECFVQSAPVARVRWFYKQQPILMNGHYSRQDRENPHANGSGIHHQFADMRHRLLIHYVRTSDIGVYECRAENNLGVKSAHIELTLKPATCVFKLNPMELYQNDSSYLLIWKTESFSPIIEFLLKFREIDDDIIEGKEWRELTIPAELSIGPVYTTSFVLNGIHPASIYEAVVSARNQFGWSDVSETLQFSTGRNVKDLKDSISNSLSERDQETLEDSRLPLSKTNTTPLKSNNATSSNFSTEDGGKLNQGNIFSSPLFFFKGRNSSKSQCDQMHLTWIILIAFYLGRELFIILF